MWSPTAASAPTARPTSPEQPASFSVSRQKNRGRRIAQIVKLKPEFLEEYKKVHAHVWPEVLKQIKQCNIEDCTFVSFLLNLPLSCPSIVLSNLPLPHPGSDKLEPTLTPR